MKNIMKKKLIFSAVERFWILTTTVKRQLLIIYNLIYLKSIKLKVYELMAEKFEDINQYLPNSFDN